ncbi:MAG: hypothetical protein QXT38_01910 [Candidatus Aenigmatarchaeota archaeon]
MIKITLKDGKIIRALNCRFYKNFIILEDVEIFNFLENKFEKQKKRLMININFINIIESE